MTALKVGLIDDENTNFLDYATRLKRHDIDLIFYEGDSNLENIIQWIISEEILCVFVDYDLQKKFAHNGTDLVFGINQMLPDFPCIMLTNYPERSRNEKLVSKRLIWDREKLNDIDLSSIVDTIYNEVEVFLKRKSSLVNQYETLAKKRGSNQFTATDEERFIQLYAIFSKYGEADDIPAQLLSSETNEKLDRIIDKLTQLLNKRED
ncbi:MAG: chemotaxis protein [Clostridia bacterium]|nr:chemotaxis protein [Clostridia bacterium]